MRTDLRALTPGTLAELTSRGLVKRATKEIEKAPPVLTEADDGTVVATFDDGVVTTLPPGALDAARCGCGATSTCRHVLGLVLAYRRRPSTAADRTQPASVDPVGPRPAGERDDHAQDAGDAAGHGVPVPAVQAASPPAGTVPAGTTQGDNAPGVDVPARTVGARSARTWSPGDFSDDELAGRIGPRMIVAARRAERAGFVARVHRARAGDPVASVELPTATVRFFVPGDLGYARSDAVAGARDDVIALAVWAFREADRVVPGVDDARVQVGGTATAGGGSGLDAALALAGLVLRDGAVHVSAGLAADIAAVRRDLDRARLRWPLLAFEDLVAQLDAYRDRSARYRPESLADHLAELYARHRAVTSGGAGLRSRVLGTDEASETPLRRARLDGLGCRVSAFGGERVVDVYLAHADSAGVLVLRHTFQTEEVGPALAARRVAGVSIGALAGGVVVTGSAVRSASRTVRLSVRRLNHAEATQARGSWNDLPAALVADDLDALAAELDALAPRPIRARIEAELIRVLPVAEVLSVRYAPGSQRLDAVIADATGSTAVVSAVHAGCAPGRLDSMAGVLAGGGIRYVAGAVRRGNGGLVVDPVGFGVGDTVVVPDLALTEQAVHPHLGGAADDDPLGAALDEGLGLLAEVAHRGLLHLPSTVTGRLRAAARRLTGLGLRRAGTDLERFAARLGPDPGGDATTAWVDAQLRLRLAADMR